MTFTQPAATPDGWELNDEALTLLHQYKQLTAELAEITQARDEIRSRLEKLLGTSEIGLHGGRPVLTWAWDQPSTVIDTARLKTEQPEIWAAYQKPRKPSRPFRLITPKDSTDG